MTQPMIFKHLSIGQTFEFSLAVQAILRGSGNVPGPWRKISARRYERVSTTTRYHVLDIYVRVDPTEE